VSTQADLDWTSADERAVDLIRVLAMDSVQKAGSGHPGTAMSLAPAAYVLYQRLLRHDPADPRWPGRDRFVLSCGHSSLTLYIQLYLSGYGLTLDDLKGLRTWGSITPGHPEHGLTPGVETTTGPLGQGLGNYMRPSVRLAALMELPVTYVWTHDSIGLGEDGPTHQPVEHLWSRRNIPGLEVVSPGDANETAVAWRTILERARPAALCLTRQNLPVLDRSQLAGAEGAARGGYVLAAGSDVILIATGSEVPIALEAREQLAAGGVSARVVSMPCVEWFRDQDESYRDEVLPPAVRARVSVEAGITAPWRLFTGEAGASIGVDHFGASADYKTLYQEFGITAERVAAAARDSLARV